MKRAIILTIILFNLFFAYLSYAEDKNPGEPPALKEQIEAGTKVKLVTKNEEINEYQTLSSLRTKQQWNYPKTGCPAGECSEDQTPNKEQPFDSEIKVNYGQVLKAVEEVQSPTIITPEIPTAVRVSARDINRVTCRAGEIKDIVYSKEKGMTVSFSGKDAYIKYKYIKRGNKTIYPSVTEMYIVCGDATYNLIAVPELIPAKTIQLSAGASDKIRKNKKYFSGMPTEKKIMTLLRAVYTDDLPESFTLEKQELGDISPYAELSIMPIRTVSASGEGIRVFEYIIKIRADAKRQEIELDERDFIEIAANPIALAIDKLKIKKGDTVRMFICEQNKGDYAMDNNPTIKINRGYVNENIKPEPKEAKKEDDKNTSKQYKIK
ncbi:MAG: TraK protein [Smithella sp. PtaU1.Bin162]|nr:MAG: TraK protein [Smithella sp. PtaU1.Bin162]